MEKKYFDLKKKFKIPVDQWNAHHIAEFLEYIELPKEVFVKLSNS